MVFNGQTLGSGTLVPGSGATSTATLNLISSYFTPGNNTVTLNYLGDDNYVPNSSSAVIPLRNPAIGANPATVNGGTSTIQVPYAFPVAGAMTFNFNPSGGGITDFSNTGATTCASGVQETAGTVCIFSIAFKPGLPGIRKGVVQVNFTPSARSGRTYPLPVPLRIGFCGADFAEQRHAADAELQPQPAAEPDL